MCKSQTQEMKLHSLDEMAAAACRRLLLLTHDSSINQKHAIIIMLKEKLDA